MITPGAYLKMRRCAAGLSAADVAARVHTEPQVDERARREWIELIEADAQPATLRTIIALKKIYPFDLQVLVRLEQIVQGAALSAPRLCQFCGCSDNDACMAGNRPCSWVGPVVCSTCAGVAGTAALQAAAS